MKHWPILVLLLLIHLGCAVAWPEPAPTGDPAPTVTGAPPVSSAAGTAAPPPTLPGAPSPLATAPAPDTGWEELRPGLERRLIRLFDDQGLEVELLYLLRLAPEMYRFDVAYRSRTPPRLDEWQAETGALVVVNGSYFWQNDSGEFLPAGLIIVDGRAIGQSHADFAGMLAITPDGPELRWLRQQPYNPAENLRAGLQSFPLLVKPGGELGFAEPYEDDQKARRTVVAQDRAGRILFLVAAEGHFTLHQLSAYLINADLDLDMALNLDGGASSGLLVADPPDIIPAFSALPIVITVHAR